MSLPLCLNNTTSAYGSPAFQFLTQLLVEKKWWLPRRHLTPARCLQGVNPYEGPKETRQRRCKLPWQMLVGVIRPVRCKIDDNLRTTVTDQVMGCRSFSVKAKCTKLFRRQWVNATEMKETRPDSKMSKPGAHTIACRWLRAETWSPRMRLLHPTTAKRMR